ncbi:hypothetical protein [Thalassotalea agarivorans]|uniref:Uncharacterized protein n=1 Tax=Thalassotalea agarivorans TaxID=349064 RepID=A0A1I0HXS4_THASX|nr:hypothetical protein [Thalassotalea agarivorans]SET88693.1 hypothetical protein SAMN05660429_02967 [Thalassotalea agarivorans]
MSEAFRIWFKFEICLFSVPVVLIPAIVFQIDSKGAPVELIVLAASLSLGCILVFYSVFKLMGYVFGNKPARHPKMIMFFILYWLINWLFTFIKSNQLDTFAVQVFAFAPIIVLGHLIYIGRDYFKSVT